MKRIFKYNVHYHYDEDGEIYFTMNWRMLGNDFEWKFVAPVVSTTLDRIERKITAIREKGDEMLWDEAL